MRTTYPSPWTLAARIPRATVLLIVVVAAVPVWLYLQLFREALIDDTFITLQYAWTLRDYGTWGFFPWEANNTATSPLNVLLTAATGLVVADMVQAALTLATVEALVLLGILLLLSRHISEGYYFGTLSFVAIMLNPLLISTLGLEPLLYITLIAACVYVFMSRRRTTLAILLALLTLTRPDGFLLFPIMLAGVLAARYRDGAALTQPASNLRPTVRSLLRLAVHFCGVYLLCLAPWYLFSWIQLGSLVPTTLLIKRQQGTWEGYDFFNGVLFYRQRYPAEVPLTLLLAPFGLLCLRLKRSRASVVAGILFLFSSIYFAAYVALGVPPYHWYFVPVVIPWSILGVLGLTSLVQRSSAYRHQPVRIVLYALPCIVALAGIRYFTDGRSLPLLQSPIHTNWATHNKYREIGRWLRDNVDAQANIELWGEIGTVAYYSERRVVDVFSCRLQNRNVLRQIRTLRGVRRLLADVNFRWLRADTACTPSTHKLVMYNYEPSAMDLPRNIIKQWVISTDWVAIGRVALARQ